VAEATGGRELLDLHKRSGLRLSILIVTILIAVMIGPISSGPLQGTEQNSNERTIVLSQGHDASRMNPVRGLASFVGVVHVNSLGSPVEPIGRTLSSPWPNGPRNHSIPARSPSRGVAPPNIPHFFTTSGSNVSVASSFEGLNQIQSCRCVPPDVNVAAGPAYILEMVNLEGEIFTKQGSSVQLFDLSQFFNTGTNFLSDPKILFDNQSGRWFASIISIQGFNSLTGAATSANIRVAVSDTDDPTSFWNIYNISVGTIIPDQPIIGVNDDKFVVSANDFSNPVTFSGAQYWVLNKAEMVSGIASVHLNTFGIAGGLISVHPAQSLSPGATDYMVSTGGAGSNIPDNIVQLFSVTGVPSASSNAVVSPPQNLTVSPIGATRSGGGGCGIDWICFPYGPIPTGGQPGTGVTVNTDDFRVLDASWYKGKLWLALNDGCVPAGSNVAQACFRLTQIDTTTTPAIVIQDFDVGTIGLDYFYPALRTDAAGNLDVVFGLSSNSNSTCCYPSIAITGQGVGDPANSLAPIRILKAGSASDTSTRYGDYFGAGLDPSDPSLVWIAGEYHNSATGSCDSSGNCWSTFIAGIRTLAFTLASSPSYLTMAAGSSATSTISLTSKQNFAGSVSLFATTSPIVTNGPTVSVSPATVTVTANQTVTSQLTVFTTNNTPAGSYNVTFVGTSGVRTYSTVLSVRVGPDFTISASPSVLSLNVGISQTSTITVSSLNKMKGTVSLTASTVPTGPTATLSSTSVNLSSQGSASVTLTVSSGSTTTAGTYLIIITGTSGSVVHSVRVTVRLVGFSVSSQPNTLTSVVGTPANTTLTLRSVNNFAGTVSLSATSTPTGLGFSFSPGNVQISSGGVAYAFLTISSSNTTPLGTYNVTVTATNGVQSHSTVVRLTLTGDFSILATPASLTIVKDKTGSTTITLTSLKGFSGTINLSISGGGPPASLSTSTITLTPGGTGSASLTVTGSNWGSFGKVITGTGGGITRSITIPVWVGGLVCLANPATVPQPPSNQCPPSPGPVLNGPLTSPPRQLRVGVYLNNSDALGGYDIILKADHNVLKPAGADFTGSILSGGHVSCLGGTGSTCSTQDNADTLHVTGDAGPNAPGVTGLLFIAVYNITGSTPGTTITFQTGCVNTSLLDGACATIFDYIGNIDTEIAQAATFATQSFSMATNPSRVSITCGTGSCDPASHVTSTITLTSLNGFSGTVNLTYVQPNPNCCTTLSGLSYAYIPLGGSVNVTITAGVFGTTSGTYTWTIIGSGVVFSTSTTLMVAYTWCGHCI